MEIISLTEYHIYLTMAYKIIIVMLHKYSKIIIAEFAFYMLHKKFFILNL